MILVIFFCMFKRSHGSRPDFLLVSFYFAVLFHSVFSFGHVSHTKLASSLFNFFMENVNYAF